MDDLNSSFGRLSTNAPEWKPGGGASKDEATGEGPRRKYGSSGAGATSTAPSDLNAIQVKEFVPGQAWGISSTGVNHPQQQSFLPAVPGGASLTAASSYEDEAEVDVGEGFQQNQHQFAYDESSASQQHSQPMESTIPAGPGPPPPVLVPPFRALHSLGGGDELWRHYRDRSLEACRQMDPGDPRHKAVPAPYCNAFCLDPPGSSSRSSFGYPSNTFQVTSREDGHLYCLRRFDNCRTVSAKIAAAVTDRWTSSHPAVEPVLDHPGIVNLVRCFVAQRAVFFVHAMVPGARTLHERMVASMQQNRHHLHRQLPNSPLLLPEPILWSCLSQLVSAVSAIHGAGLAVRSLDVHHVLVTELPPATPYGMPPSDLPSAGDRWRLHVNCVGIADALEFETRRHIYEWQQLDLKALGLLMLSLATVAGLDSSTAALLLGHGGQSASQGLAANSSAIVQAEGVLARSYSRELHNLIMTLLKSGSPNLPQRHPGGAVPPPQPPSPSIRDVSRAIWAQTQVEADRADRDADRLEAALASEYDSSRILRLILKLGFVNERPELGPNRRWAQSGDCYVLTLFRDYVFHQADGAGFPVMDLGHVITALNKLDAGDPEKIVLASRDGVSVMVVSYADVARCLESAFLELCASHNAVAQAPLPY